MNGAHATSGETLHLSPTQVHVSPRGHTSAYTTSSTSGVVGARYLSFQDWRHVCHGLCSRGTWITALKTQALLVRNAAGSIVGAWIPIALCTLGNVFSGKSYMEQSRNELLAATCVWATLTFCLAIFGVFAVLSLRSLRFIDSPDTRPTLWFCVKRLGPVTSVYLSATISVVLSATCVITYLTSIVPGLFKYTIECYVTTFSLMGYVTGMSRTMVKIYHEETCQGREKLAKKEKAAREPKGSTQREPTTRLRRASSSYLLRYRTPTFWRTYAKAVSVTLPVFLANIFVHVLSRQRLVDRDGVVLTGFVVASIVFKLAVQEIVKLYIFRRRVRSARVMCVLVGIPTVIIDTQTRIILIGKNNTNTAAMGALGMAVIEIFLRAGKTMRVMWEVRHHEHALERQNNVSWYPTKSRILPTTVGHPLPSQEGDLDSWRRRLQTFHMAEINADMYAEYISIGCSASILFFYGSHPHYSLLRQSGTARTTAADLLEWRLSQMRILGVQIAMEVVVDFASILLRTCLGLSSTAQRNWDPSSLLCS